MSNLLEQAKNNPKRVKFEITPEIVELALAWANDELSMAQIKKTLGVKEGHKLYSILARGLKEKIRSSFKEYKLPADFDATKIIPPVEVVKKIEQTNHAKKESENNPGVGDIAPGRY